MHFIFIHELVCLSLVCHSCTFGTLALSYSCTITVPLSHYYFHALLNTYISILLLNTWDQIFQGGLNISYSVLKYSVRGDQIGGTKFFMTGVQCLLGNMYHTYMQELNAVVVFIFVPRPSWFLQVQSFLFVRRTGIRVCVRNDGINQVWFCSNLRGWKSAEQLCLIHLCRLLHIKRHN